MKGRALKRASESKDSLRIDGGVPLISDSTELITPEKAREMLRRNKNNRPINWNKVEEYADIMKRGEWKLHSQGIVLDTSGNILTGQKRLWAIIYSQQSILMRVSTGNPADVVRYLDRGVPQSARDLATRQTGRKHSPVEASLARGCWALEGVPRPTKDQLADMIESNASIAAIIISKTRGAKKTRSLLMILSAICTVNPDRILLEELIRNSPKMAEKLSEALAPQTAEQCWCRGAAFGLAMEHARQIVSKPRSI